MIFGMNLIQYFKKKKKIDQKLNVLLKNDIERYLPHSHHECIKNIEHIYLFSELVLCPIRDEITLSSESFKYLSK